MENPHFGSKIEIPKNISKSIVQMIYSRSVKKTARKKINYSRNDTILKISHNAKAIAHAKYSLWVKIEIFKKTCQNPIYISFKLLLCKKLLQKTTQIFEK